MVLGGRGHNAAYKNEIFEMCSVVQSECMLWESEETRSWAYPECVWWCLCWGLWWFFARSLSHLSPRTEITFSLPCVDVHTLLRRLLPLCVS